MPAALAPDWQVLISKHLGESTHISLLICDSERRILFANRGAQRLLGYGPDEILGMDLSRIFTPEDNEMGVACQELAVAARQGGSEDERWHVKKDGTRFWASGAVVPIRNDHDELVGWIKLFRDHTIRKRTEETLEASNADLAQYAYTISHDLQEPLRTMSVSLQLLERTQAPSHLQAARQAAARMRSLISETLQVTQGVDRHQLVEWTDVNSVFDVVAANLKALVEEHGATLRRGVLPTVPAVPIQLSRVLQNLVTNSIKHRSEAPPKISVEAFPGRDEWVFQVKDNGKGIPPERRQEVFDSRSGLGLGICRTIVERHGGRIWVESTPGKGSTFFFTLPARQLVFSREQDRSPSAPAR